MSRVDELIAEITPFVNHVEQGIKNFTVTQEIATEFLEASLKGFDAQHQWGIDLGKKIGGVQTENMLQKKHSMCADLGALELEEFIEFEDRLARLQANCGRQLQLKTQEIMGAVMGKLNITSLQEAYVDDTGAARPVNIKATLEDLGALDEEGNLKA